MKLFSGTANTPLSETVSKAAGIPLSRAEVIRFGNSEVKVTLQESVADETCAIIQPTSNPTDTNLMELCLFCDALRREEAKRVIGIIPYFGYAKQNIQHREGECVSVNVVIKFLESIGFAKIYTFDLHDEATAGVFSIPFRNLSAFGLLAENVKEYFKGENIKPGDVALVSPDQGAVEKIRKFGTVFYGTDKFKEVVIEKKRDQDNAHRAEPYDLYGDVEGKIALIVDDMVVSGSTMIPAVDLCLARGATAVYAVAVHPDFTSSAPTLLQESKIKRFFTTDSILMKEEYKFPKLEIVSIAPLIAELVKK